MSFQIEKIHQAEFDALRDPWNDLLGRSASDNIFLRWEWIHAWWAFFRLDRALSIWTARSDGRLVGIAPCFIDLSGPYGSRMLKLCGDDLSPDYLDWILEPGLETELAREFASVLKNANDWDVLLFDNLKPDSILLRSERLFTPLYHASAIWQKCPYVKIEGSFDAYYRSRSELLHFEFEKKRQKLLDEKKITHHIVQDERTLKKGLDDLFLLHQKRADSIGRKSNALSEAVQQFHGKVSAAFLAQGFLNLQLLYDGQNAISAIYGFSYRNQRYLYMMGFDPQWGKWSAGAVLLYLDIQQAFEKDLSEYDFLKGMEHYKALWTNSVREEKRLVACNTTLRGRLGGLSMRAKSLARKVAGRKGPE